MSALLAFAFVLLVAVLVSGIAERSVLSTAVLFLVAGFVLGEGVIGVLALRPDDPIVSWLADLALFSVLFTDGMHAGVQKLQSAWRLPGRALLLGLPLTLAATAALAHVLVGLPWLDALLVGAVLSPTDPVFAAAIVGRPDISRRLRELLNVESGLNDGLALPIVLALLATMGAGSTSAGAMAIELLSGIALGIAVPWICVRIGQSRALSIANAYEPLFALAVGLLVLSLAKLTHANEYLAAFSAGITLGSIGSHLSAKFRELGESAAEVLKLAAVLAFGALISPQWLSQMTWSGWAFAFGALFIARPLALELALLGSRLGWRERLVAAWFGPKGFASVIYGILILHASVPRAETLFHLVAIVIAGSIIAHSSTDVVVARWLRTHERQDGRADQRGGSVENEGRARRM